MELEKDTKLTDSYLSKKSFSFVLGTLYLHLSLSPNNHEPSILTMRRDARKKKIICNNSITRQTLVTKQLLGNVFKTFQNGWILVGMLSFLLVVFRFFLMEFQLVFLHENQQLKTNINEMFENSCK